VIEMIILLLLSCFVVLLFFYIAMSYTNSRKKDQDAKLLAEIRELVREELQFHGTTGCRH
jgi:sensor domain CHASE-containing protein